MVGRFVRNTTAIISSQFQLIIIFLIHMPLCNLVQSELQELQGENVLPRRHNSSYTETCLLMSQKEFFFSFSAQGTPVVSHFSSVLSHYQLRKPVFTRKVGWRLGNNCSVQAVLRTSTGQCVLAKVFTF